MTRKDIFDITAVVGTILAFGILLATALIALTKPGAIAEHKPKFEVGDCFYFKSGIPTEDWEKPPAIKMVMQVGKAAYKTCIFDWHCAAVLSGDASPISESFIYDDRNVKTQCNPE